METDKLRILKEISENPHSGVKVAVTDIDGVLRGKVMLKEKFLSAVEKGFGFCDVVFGWDSSDIAYDNVAYTGWHTGYPDADAQIDVSTYRKIPWENDLPLFLADFSDRQKDGAVVCPRRLLRNIADQCREMGFYPAFSQEFEWFNFRETPQSFKEKGYRNPEPLTPGMFGYSVLRASMESPFFQDLFNLMHRFRIPLEGLHTETGPGVYEAAIHYSNIEEAADRAVLFKTGVKEIGYRHGILASFMAKWSMSLPGCSGHVHQSLWDLEKMQNLFFDSEKPDQMSDLMRSYIAGQLYCLPYILPMYAPVINSYKRLVEGAWAPTTLTWAVDNRTVALRALPVSPSACRLETRVIGSDANPYLSMAACLASGLYGIRNKMSLTVEPTKGNGYRNTTNGMLPPNLFEATKLMKESPIATELFGKQFVDHFTATRDWEWRQFAQSVTDWEFKRYFEII